MARNVSARNERSATWRATDAVSTVRQLGGSREIEGVAVPYGAVALSTDIGAEAFAPGAFRDSVSHWMGRQDGARMAFRPAHRQPAIGTVTHLEDAPDGVRFRAAIREGEAGDAYLRNVADGLNGVSIEFGPGDVAPSRGRDGTTVHRAARMHAIAGSESPAYDGARVSLRDLEGPMNCEHCGAALSYGVAHTCATDPAAPAPAPAAPAPAPAAPAGGDRDANPNVIELTPQLRAALEAAGVRAIRPSIRTLRPEAVYSPSGEHNYLRDTWLAAKGDTDARERQARHGAHLHDVAVAMEREAGSRFLDPAYSERAGDLLSSEIPGAYPNQYLPGLLTPRILKGRPMADFYQRFAIADALPKIFAKITTSTAVAVQSAEGAALSSTDMASTAVTANPLMYGATIDVSRQTLDGADPSALAMLYQDLLEAYSQASETVVKTAVEAGSTASGVAITAATPYAGTLSNVVNYYAQRFKGANGAFIPSALFPVLAAQGDTTGRPFLPMIGAQNSDGTTTADDTSLALAVLTARSALSYASTVNVCVFGRPSDFVIYESPITTVSYDQVVGPQAVRIGLWAYLAVGARLGSLKVTAA